MKETDIDDRGLTPTDPADPGAPQPTPTADGTCPECAGAGTLGSGDVCPLCQGTGRANARVGGG